MRKRVFAILLIYIFTLSGCRAQNNTENTVESVSHSSMPVSEGIEIPDLAGVDCDSAKESILKKNLLPVIEYEYSPVITKGTVIRTNPLNGVKVEEDSKVTIYVSKGPAGYTAVDGTIEWYSLGNTVRDEWKFVNPQILEDSLYISCELIPGVAFEFKNSGFGVGSLTDTFDKTVPIRLLKSDLTSFENNKTIRAGEAVNFFIVIPLDQLDSEFPTHIACRLVVLVNSVETNIEVKFSMHWEKDGERGTLSGKEDLLRVNANTVYSSVESNDYSDYNYITESPTPIITQSPMITPITTGTLCSRTEFFNDASINLNYHYIILYSTWAYLDESNLYGLSKEECRLARNEIYARHGRLFKDASLTNYFESQNWYFGYIQPENFNDDILNEYERYNIDFIKKYEDSELVTIHKNDYRWDPLQKIVKFYEIDYGGAFYESITLYFFDEESGMAEIEIEDEDCIFGGADGRESYYFILDDDMTIYFYRNTDSDIDIPFMPENRVWKGKISKEKNYGGEYYQIYIGEYEGYGKGNFETAVSDSYICEWHYRSNLEVG
ncbi:MAG: YARHG domain-containing protein [Lachnospiraceae bacterium]|nr:YARHG domain-containing protein [Lachnospiraceae bacterium]